jgi:hypothetical protein
MVFYVRKPQEGHYMEKRLRFSEDGKPIIGDLDSDVIL